LINGESSGIFSSSRGIRQGDPLSPFLFVIVMEALSRMMAATKDSGLVFGFSMGTRNDPELSVSYLLFADDTFVFCGANENQLRNLLCLFQCFEAVSGLKLTCQSLRLFQLVKWRMLIGWRAFFNCRVAGLPMKYLGLPLGAPYKSTTIWNDIVEKMRRKWAGWKKTYLSKGGRLTPIKSTLSNLPMYFLSLFPIPVNVVNRLEKLQRDFLWGGLNEEPKFHLVKWAQICSPMQGGGLGIWNLGNFNLALLGKWLW
jgi:hypothetical protein